MGLGRSDPFSLAPRSLPHRAVRGWVPEEGGGKTKLTGLREGLGLRGKERAREKYQADAGIY